MWIRSNLLISEIGFDFLLNLRNITAAKGSNALAYIEIESGPYLVLPKEEASDNGEKPINVDASNVVWLDASNSAWIDQPEGTASAQIAFLWGNPQGDQPTGTLVKFPAGFTGEIRSDGSTIRAVVIKGNPKHEQPGEEKTKTLEPGNYFGSDGEAVHQISCEDGEECTIYLRTVGKFVIGPAQKS